MGCGAGPGDGIIFSKNPCFINLQLFEDLVQVSLRDIELHVTLQFFFKDWCVGRICPFGLEKIEDMAKNR